jgi:hypothetical protein
MTKPVDPTAVMDANNDEVSAGDAACVLLDGLHLLMKAVPELAAALYEASPELYLRIADWQWRHRLPWVDVTGTAH